MEIAAAKIGDFAKPLSVTKIWITPRDSWIHAGKFMEHLYLKSLIPKMNRE